MSGERAAFRGARGPSRGRGDSGRGGRGDSSAHRGRGGGSGGGGTQAQLQAGERPKKENILDLGKYMDKRITVKFSGGREVVGTLKGYDQLLNLVLDDVEEMMRDDADTTTSTRPLGLLVARGTLLTTLAPLDGSEEIANPFVDDDADASNDE